MLTCPCSTPRSDFTDTTTFYPGLWQTRMTLPTRSLLLHHLRLSKPPWLSIFLRSCWLFLTHFSFPFSTAYSFTFIYLNTLLLSVLAPLPRRWALISLLVSALSIPHFPIPVLHISLFIALISSHTFSTIHHTSRVVSKLTFRHYHLNPNLNCNVW